MLRLLFLFSVAVSFSVPSYADESNAHAINPKTQLKGRVPASIKRRKVEPAPVPAVNPFAVPCVIQKNCNQCHSDKGWVNPGTLSKKLRSAEEKNEFIKRIQHDPGVEAMPPSGRMADDDIETLRKWVNSGMPKWGAKQDYCEVTTEPPANPVPDLRSDFGLTEVTNPNNTKGALSPVELANLVIQDRAMRLRRKDNGQLPDYRYFSLVHLKGTEMEEYLPTYRAALEEVINTVSLAPNWTPIEPVDKEELVFRVDIESLGWLAKDFNEQIKAKDQVYRRDNFVAAPLDFQAGRGRQNVIDGLNALVPADMFINEALNGQAYLRLRNFPQTLQQFEASLGVNVAALGGRAVRGAPFFKEGYVAAAKIASTAETHTPRTLAFVAIPSRRAGQDPTLMVQSRNFAANEPGNNILNNPLAGLVGHGDQGLNPAARDHLVMVPGKAFVPISYGANGQVEENQYAGCFACHGFQRGYIPFEDDVHKNIMAKKALGLPLSPADQAALQIYPGDGAHNKSFGEAFKVAWDKVHNHPGSYWSKLPKNPNGKYTDPMIAEGGYGPGNALNIGAKLKTPGHPIPASVNRYGLPITTEQVAGLLAVSQQDLKTAIVQDGFLRQSALIGLISDGGTINRDQLGPLFPRLMSAVELRRPR